MASRKRGAAPPAKQTLWKYFKTDQPSSFAVTNPTDAPPGPSTASCQSRSDATEIILTDPVDAPPGPSTAPSQSCSGVSDTAIGPVALEDDLCREGIDAPSDQSAASAPMLSSSTTFSLDVDDIGLVPIAPLNERDINPIVASPNPSKDTTTPFRSDVADKLGPQATPDASDVPPGQTTASDHNDPSTSTQQFTEPNHPHDPSLIPTQTITITSGSGTKSRILSFQEHWFQRFPWLHWQDSKILCFYCSSEIPARPLTAKKHETTFVSTGYSNWKKALEKFQAHEKSQQHIQSTESYKNRHISPIVVCSDAHTTKEQKSSRNALQKIISTLMYLARQGLAIRGHKEDEGNFMSLLRLRAEDSPNLATWLLRYDSGKKQQTHFLSHDIQNEMLVDISHEILAKLKISISKARYFALICDGTQDVSGKEQESVCIRYVDDDFEPHEVFVGMYETSETTGRAIANLLKDVCIRLDIPLSNLRGQTYDGASNMSGAYNGAQAIIMEKQPLAYYTHCSTHCVNLVASAVADLPLIRDAVSNQNALGVLFAQTIKFRKVFESQVEGEQSQRGKKLRPLCPTRWTVRHAALSECLEKYEKIIGSLAQFQTEQTLTPQQKAKAAGLERYFLRGESFLAVQMASDIFGHLEALVNSAQGRQTTMAGVLKSVDLASTKLQLDREKFNTKFEEVTKRVNDMKEVQLIEMPRQRRVPGRLGGNQNNTTYDTTQEYYRVIFLQAYDTAITELQRRFDEGKPALQAYCDLQDCLLTGTTNDEIGKYPELNAAALESELAVFLNKWSVTTLQDYVNALREAPPEVRAFLPNVCALVKLLLVRPASSAECERTFSALRRLKTWLRSTMSQVRLNAVALAHVHQSLLDQLDTRALSAKFVNKKETRFNIFGKFK